MTRGRGFGRGRGGFGSFDGSMNQGAYDQGNDTGAYNNYEGSPQDPYYQSNGYGGGPPAQFPSADYNQGGFNNYEGALENLRLNTENAVQSAGGPLFISLAERDIQAETRG